jgi:hypothetical protein
MRSYRYLVILSPAVCPACPSICIFTMLDYKRRQLLSKSYEIHRKDKLPSDSGYSLISINVIQSVIASALDVPAGDVAVVTSAEELTHPGGGQVTCVCSNCKDAKFDNRSEVQEALACGNSREPQQLMVPIPLHFFGIRNSK